MKIKGPQSTKRLQENKAFQGSKNTLLQGQRKPQKVSDTPQQAWILFAHTFCVSTFKNLYEPIQDLSKMSHLLNSASKKARSKLSIQVQ